MSCPKYQAEWRRNNRAKCNSYTRKYRQKHLEERRAADREVNKNPTVRARKTANAKAWRHRNPDKLRASNKRHYEKQREWARNHPEVYVYNALIRRRMQRQAKPKWLTKEQLEEIRAIYKSAQTRSTFHEEPFHVDHIEPIKGVNEKGEHVSCGLHVPWNLQVLPATENIKKSNKMSLNQLKTE